MFKCELCPRKKGFRTERGLAYHRRLAHGDTTPVKKKAENRPAIVFRPSGVVEVHFCPKCGCNIDAVKNALAIAGLAQEVGRG